METLLEKFRDAIISGGGANATDNFAYNVHIESAIKVCSEITKQEMKNFAEWCTVHPPKGSGAGYGLYEKSTEDLIEEYFNQNNNNDKLSLHHRRIRRTH